LGSIKGRGWCRDLFNREQFFCRRQGMTAPQVETQVTPSRLELWPGMPDNGETIFESGVHFLLEL